MTLPDPTQLADRLFQIGRLLLEKEIDGTAYRLLGIGVSDLQSDERADPGDLVDELAGRRAAAEQAMDKVRDKFGRDAVELGLTFRAWKSKSDNKTETEMSSVQIEPR